MWTKHFNFVKKPDRLNHQMNLMRWSDRENTNTIRKYSSILPEIYAGHPLRIERYQQYDQMDNDSEVNISLNIIADYCTQPDDKTKHVFNLHFNEEALDHEQDVLRTMLHSWMKLNDFDRDIWNIVRKTIKYGDQFYIRDPETLQWFFVNHSNVESILVNEETGKNPDFYIMRNLDLFLQPKVAIPADDFGNNYMSLNTNFMNRKSVPSTASVTAKQQGSSTYGYGFQGSQQDKIWAVDAKHVVHISIGSGLDANWPFGTSILEGVFKTYKQKELLEEAILIYRIVRAPERRIFQIDVGDMPPYKSASYLEKVKNEMYQRRIANKTGGGLSVVDAGYNAMSMTEDFYFAKTADGRSSTVETLPGGENLGCFSLDTKVRLLDGRDLSIQDIETELSNGKKLWTYSCHPVTGSLAPGLITWAGKTRSQAQVMKITLDNGSSFVCTPDHKFPILGIGFVEAKDLRPNQSMIPFYTKHENLDTKNGRKYEQVFNPSNKQWIYTHRMVSQFLKNTDLEEILIHKKEYDDTFTTIHHKDFNSLNNTPENLFLIHYQDSLDPRSQYHGEYVDAIKLNASERWKKTMNNRGKHFKQKKKPLTLVTTQLMMSKIIDYYNSGLTNCVQLINAINNDLEFMAEFMNLNNNKRIGRIRQFSYKHLQSILITNGYSTFKSFQDNYQFNNHRIISIEYLPDLIDVGTLSIDGDEIYHDYHTFALSCGVFTKNSIDDLKYWNNKLARALGIPSSYLPTGPEDSQAVYSDGRVGTAYQQEQRFSRYCERLQGLIISAFDQEFKRYLKKSGVVIDSGIFELKFNEPQNFAQYAQIERDSAQLDVYAKVAELKYISRRFGLKKWAGLTEEEIIENERLWKLENAKKVGTLGKSEMHDGGGGLSDIGIKSSDLNPENDGFGDEDDMVGDGELNTTDDGGIDNMGDESPPDMGSTEPASPKI